MTGYYDEVVKTWGKVWRDDTKIFEQKADSRTYCKCGHSMLISPSKEKRVCSHCGRYVFKDSKAEFEFRLKEKLIREKRS